MAKNIEFTGKREYLFERDAVRIRRDRRRPPDLVRHRGGDDHSRRASMLQRRGPFECL